MSMNILHIKCIYFIGIGGAGMSALARFFKEQGAKVAGYDRAATALTHQLEAEGIAVTYSEDVAHLMPEARLVVYTPAIPPTHPQLMWYKENGYTILKRSDVLQAITQSMEAVTIAGSHGKTTITTMIAFIMSHSGFGCNAFIGGISTNYNTNYWGSNNNIAVVEADEYDRSFLKLSPYIALLTAMDADHLDIYGTVENMQDAYIAYTQQVKPNGMLLYKHGLPLAPAFNKQVQHYTYSVSNTDADSYALNITPYQRGYKVDAGILDDIIEDIYLPMGGIHNVENMIAAATVCSLHGISSVAIKNAIAEFKGVKRRFEYIVDTAQAVYIDDYAHHPQELEALITSAKQLYPDRECTVIFQPHLFSRTRDFADGFAQSLAKADNIWLLDIYPAREQPIEGITSATIAELITTKPVKIYTKADVLSLVDVLKPSLLITAGAGDIDTLVDNLKTYITHEKEP
ncbi:MAG: UDP-N-acetylmuramate--L-alanine ligase [Chitinophagia bacterium]|nr:UDP-N-acetylmuramate--L-alanine ligase [Chitinophagia bacterium]